MMNNNFNHTNDMIKFFFNLKYLGLSQFEIIPCLRAFVVVKWTNFINPN